MQHLNEQFPDHGPFEADVCTVCGKTAYNIHKGAKCDYSTDIVECAYCHAKFDATIPHACPVNPSAFLDPPVTVTELLAVVEAYRSWGEPTEEDKVMRATLKYSARKALKELGRRLPPIKELEKLHTAKKI